MTPSPSSAGSGTGNSQSSDAGVAQSGRAPLKGVSGKDDTTSRPEAEQSGKVSGSKPLPGAEDTPPTKPCEACDTHPPIPGLPLDRVKHIRDLHALLAAKEKELGEAVALIRTFYPTPEIEAFLAVHPPSGDK